MRRTPHGKSWGCVWDEIDKNQTRKPGKRRNRYHITWEPRITKPGRPEKYETVTVWDEKPNPLDPTHIQKWQRTEKRLVSPRIPTEYAPTEMIYFDVDDLDEIDAFKKLPNAIWCRSPSGRLHIFVLILPGDYDRVRKRVAEWMYKKNVKAENNVVPRKGKILDTILIPGQDQWTLPCAPGQPDKSIVSDYQATISLFVEHWNNNRLDVDKAFPISREISEPAPIVEKKTEVPKPESSKPIKVKRNRPRLGGLCNLPGLVGPMRITRNKGTEDEQTFEYRTIEDCRDETDGFNIGWSYFAALTRKHHGDVEHAYSDFISNRQFLRTLSSKKHHHSFLLSHARSMKKHAKRTFDPKKMQHSQRGKQDAVAMQSVNEIDPKVYTSVIQQELKNRKFEIVEKFGKRVYRAIQDCIPLLTEDIQSNNGRIAQRSKKSRDEYTFGDSRTIQDYFDGNRYLLSVVLKVLCLYILDVSDLPNWSEAKCTRWTYKKEIVEKAKNRCEYLTPQRGKNRIISSTNLGAYRPTYTPVLVKNPALDQMIDSILDDIDEHFRDPALN